MARWIAGLDGCRGAWAGALMDHDDPERFRCGRFESVAACSTGGGTPRPRHRRAIGLPDRILGGGRTADLAARARLGPARASVFRCRRALPSMRPITTRPSGFPARAATRPSPLDPGLEHLSLCPGGGSPPARPAGLAPARPRGPPGNRLPCPQWSEAPRPAEEGAARGSGSRPAPGAAGRRRIAEGPDRGAPPGVPADDHLDALAGLVTARDILLGRASPFPKRRSTTHMACRS